MSAGPIQERNQDATVYVGGLDSQVTENMLWELFVQAGPVVNVHMPRDRITQQHQSYGFVEFMGEDDADYAIKIMNMIKVYGKPIRVNKAASNTKNLDVGANVFIGNLDIEIDEKLLYDIFSAFGVILQTPKIMRDPDTGNSKGFAFVNYASFDSSDAAIEAMNGQHLCNRAISVSYAFKKDAKGERHGSAAERMLAAQNPLTQIDRPHQLFADAPPTAPSVMALPPPFMPMGMAPPAIAPPVGMHMAMPPHVIAPPPPPPSMPPPPLMATPHRPSLNVLPPPPLQRPGPLSQGLMPLPREPPQQRPPFIPPAQQGPPGMFPPPHPRGPPQGAPPPRGPPAGPPPPRGLPLPPQNLVPPRALPPSHGLPRPSPPPRAPPRGPPLSGLLPRPPPTSGAPPPRSLLPQPSGSYPPRIPLAPPGFRPNGSRPPPLMGMPRPPP